MNSLSQGSRIYVRLPPQHTLLSPSAAYGDPFPPVLTLQAAEWRYEITQKCSGFTKKKALILVLGLGVLILLLIVLRAVFAPGTEFDLSTLDGREAFLNSLGWEIDRSTEEFRTVVVPDKLEGIMAQYNRMQQAQGYDLSDHLGERCSQYSYQLTNYADSDGTVIITIYVQENEVIAGDIHTTAVNGFMHGLKRNAQTQK